jgi:alpha-glucosidase
LRAWDRQRHVNEKDQPELVGFLAELRAIVDEVPGRMTVSELFEGTPALAARHVVPRHLVFDFRLLEQPWRAEALADAIDEREAAYGPNRWPAVVLSNHDRPRHASRFAHDVGGDNNRDAVAMAAAVLLLTLRGTPFLYYGEEIALGDVRVPRAEIVDPPARRYWPLPLWWNRDQCRAPMPWSSAPGGGFTTGRPWMRMAPDVAVRNVGRQAVDPRSVLAAYRAIIALRRTSPALETGGFRWVARARDGVLAYRRDAGKDAVLVAINLRGRSARVVLGEAATGSTSWYIGYSTSGSGRSPIDSGELRLAAYEAVILRARASG